MPTLNQLVAGLPPTTGGRLMELRADVRESVKPYKRVMRDSDGLAVEQIVTPRSEVHVQWDEPTSVIVVLEQWKPEYRKEVVAQFADEEYEVIKNHINHHECSWESFFRQVVENG